MNDYLRRLGKYLLFIAVILFILFLPRFIKGGQDPWQTLQDLFIRQQLFFIVLVVYLFIYPILVYGKKERHLNGSFANNKEGIFKTFDDYKYVKTEELENKIIFRKKSNISRLITMGEDRIIIDFSNNPIIMSGIKKDLARIDRLLDVNLLTKE